MTERRGATVTKSEVKQTWQLVELHGCWWAYEGELPLPEAFTTHGHARHILGPFPSRAMAEQQLPRHLSLRETRNHSDALSRRARWR
jgi:hypothetical protein